MKTQIFKPPAGISASAIEKLNLPKFLMVS